MTTRKLVDPIHFFDAQGFSVLNNEFLCKRIDELEAEVAKLKRLLAAQVRRNAETTPRIPSNS